MGGQGVLLVSAELLKDVGISDVDALLISQSARDEARAALKLPFDATLESARWQSARNEIEFRVSHKNLAVVAAGQRLPTVVAEFQSDDGVVSFRGWREWEV